MPSSTGAITFNKIQWGSNDVSIRYFDVYRRDDNVTASITTADVIAKVGFGSNHYEDPTDGRQYWYWVKAVSWAGNESGFSDTISAIFTQSPTNEPSGFPNRTDSVLSWDDGTRTLSISPSVTSFAYYIKGEKFIKTAAQTIVPTNTTGQTWFYFDSSSLTSVSNPTYEQTEELIEEKALVAMLYWNTAQATKVLFGDERHGITMDGMTHHYLHDTIGLAYGNGLSLVNFTADQTGADDPDAQFGHTAGKVYDEDIEHTADATASTIGLPILYREGSGGPWRSTTNVGFSVVTASAGTRIVWNEDIAGTWQLTEVSNNQFVLCHVFFTNNIDNQMIAIVGQSDYGNLAAAQTGATTEINSLLLGDLPGPEMRPIGTVIFQTSNAYGNQVNARVRVVAGGADYIDWRTSDISGAGVSVSDHGSLSGLADDDHSQYLLLSGRGGQVIDDSLTVSGAVTINNNLGVTGTLTVDGTTIINNSLTVSTVNVTANMSVQNTLHVSGAVTLGDSLSVSGVSSFNNNVNISGALTASTLNITAAASVQTTLHVSGAVTFGDSLTVSGITTINNNLTASNINVTASVSVQNTLHVSGAVTFGETLSVSGISSFNNDVNVSGTLTNSTLVVTGNSTLHGTLSVSGTVTFGSTLSVSGAVTINSYMDMIEIAVPANPAATHGRLYVAETAGTTTLFFRDSAGTETNLLTGSGGNALYLESGGVAQWDTSGSDGYLNFDSNDFSLTTNGQSSTVSLASGISLEGGLTVSGGLIVSGATTLGGNTTVCGTLTVSGITTIGGALILSGSITLQAGNKIENTAAGTITIDASLAPTADTTIALGTATERFSSVYTQEVYFNTNTYMNATANGTIRVRGSITPTADNTFQVGDSTYKWSQIYANAIHLHNSVQAAFGNDGVGTYITQYRSLLPSVSNSYNLGTATLSYNNIWGHEFYCREFIEFTASTTDPSTPDNGIRLYAKVTGSLTKLMYVDSGGTTYQMPGTGGGGNALYVEEGANPEWDTSGADGYLNFDASDFLLTTNGQSSTVSLASGLSLDGGLTVNGGLVVSSGLTVSGATTLNGGLTVSGTATINGGMLVSGSGTFSGIVGPSIDSTYDLGGYGVGGVGPMWRYLFISREIWGKNDARMSFTASGCIELPNTDLQLTSGTIVVGNAAITPTSTKQIHAEHSYTSPTSTDAAIYASCRVAPTITATSTIFKVGIDGFCIMDNTNATCNIAGLRFGPYVIGTTGGSTASSTTYGINTWAARAYSGTFQAQNAYGLHITPWINDSGSQPQVTNMYGLYINDSSNLNGTGTITNLYSAYIAEPTRGTTNNYQAVLAGNGTAGHGLWIGGTGGIHVGYSGTFLYATGLRNQAGSFNMRYNTTTKEVSYTSSSRKYKENIRPLRDDWYKLFKAEPKKFNFIRDEQDSIGYIAEEFDEIGLEELVTYAGGEPVNIEYDKITLYLLEIVKDQQSRIDRLEKLLAKETKETKETKER